jgi:hypothetical protein
MSLDPDSDAEEHAQNGSTTETGNTIPDPEQAQEWTIKSTPKVVKQYGSKANRGADGKRRDKVVSAEKQSMSDDDEEPSEADEPMDDVPAAKPRTTKRQLSKTDVREPTGLSARAKRAPTKAQAKAKASAHGSEGSDLTDIGEENEGKDVKVSGDAERESFGVTCSVQS